MLDVQFYLDFFLGILLYLVELVQFFKLFFVINFIKSSMVMFLPFIVFCLFIPKFLLEVIKKLIPNFLDFKEYFLEYFLLIVKQPKVQ